MLSIKKIPQIFLVIFLFITLFIKCNEEQNPTCTILNPKIENLINQGDLIIVSVEAEDIDGRIDNVEFLIDDSITGSVKSFPYNFEWNTAKENIGFHTINVKAFNNNGNSTEDEIEVEIIERKIVSIPGDSLEIAKDTIAPTDIILSNTIVEDNDNDDLTIFIGTLSTIDNKDAVYFTYSLVNDLGNHDNYCFFIRDNRLYTSPNFYFSNGNEYTINIQTIDADGNSFIKPFAIKVERNELKAMRHYNEIQCDGIIEEPWSESGWISLSEVKNFPNSTNNDFSAEVQIAVDESSLYFAIKVKDKTIGNATNFSERDNIELFISMDTIHNPDGLYKESSWYFRIQRNEDNELISKHFDGYSGPNNTEITQIINPHFFYEWGKTDNGSEYIFELMFPIEELMVNSAFINDYFLFDIGVTDNSGIAKTGQRWLNSNSGLQGKDTRVLGKVRIPENYVF